MEQSESLRLIPGVDLTGNKRAMEAYQEQRSARADEYLESRGLLSIADTAHLGEVTDPLPGHERFRGHLTIPYLGPGGVYQIRYRCIRHSGPCDGHGKYNQEAGVPTMMYGVNAIVEAEDEISVTEGELDALTLMACGMPAVAIPGANNWKPHFQTMLFGFQRIYLWADPDEAGQSLVKVMRKALRATRVVPLEMDVNDTYRKYGQFGLDMALEEVQ